MKILRIIAIIGIFALVGFYVNAIQPKALKNVSANDDVTGYATATNTPQTTATTGPTDTSAPTNTGAPTDTIAPATATPTTPVSTITANPTCIPIPLCYYDSTPCLLAFPIGTYCPAVTPTNTPEATATPTDTPTVSPTNGPTATPTLPANCTPVTVYLNGVAVVACQEQLQGQNQSINFNPVINNDPTNNNNNNNTNNNNINLSNNNGGQVLGAVYNPSNASSLPGTGVPTIIWEVLGGITPLGFVLRKFANK